MGSIYTIGECLIDFIPSEKGLPLSKVENFKRVAGGAPANVAAAAATLEKDAYFIGMVGYDPFGTFLEEELIKSNVNTKYLKKTDKAKTALAFVSLKIDGDRDFSFYRDPSADMLLEKEDVKNINFKDDDILHFCSVSLIEAPIKYTHKYLLEKAEKEKATISFDVNLRPMLYPNDEVLRKTVLEFLPYANIIKMSEEELEFITNETDERKAAKKVFSLSLRCNYLFVTKGSKGATLYNKNLEFINQDGYKVEVVDTTGAGDCFIAAVLSKLLNKRLTKIEEFIPILQFACLSSALSITKKGAIGSFPRRDEIELIKPLFENK